MVKAELSRIIIDEKKQEQVIVLKEFDGSRLLPIVIGTVEAVSIRMHLSAIKSPRPLTHDLMASILTDTGISIERVVVDALVNNTFHAKLHIIDAGGNLRVADSRPSDAIALAVRFNAPIYIAQTVFDRLSRQRDGYV